MKKLYILILLFSMSACAYVDTMKGRAGKLMTEAAHRAENVTCDDLPMIVWKKEYGSSSERCNEWVKFCKRGGYYPCPKHEGN